MSFERARLGYQEPLRTSLQAGGNALFSYEPVLEEINSVLMLSEFARLPLLVVGDGTNLLVSDEGFSGIVVRLSDADDPDFVHQSGGDVLVSVSAAYNWDRLVAGACFVNLRGIECLSGIPGTVGGAVYGNIGAYGQELSEVITAVHVLDRRTSSAHRLMPKDCYFGYRRSIFSHPLGRHYIITGATLRLSRTRELCLKHREVAASAQHWDGAETVRRVVMSIRQRKGMLLREDGSIRSVGSFFKNPVVSVATFEAVIPTDIIATGANRWWWSVPDGIKVSAAWLVERAGFLKGYVHGKAGISEQHALAIVNLGNARAADIVALARLMQEKVFAQFRILLEPEVQLIGFKKYPLLKWPD